MDSSTAARVQKVEIFLSYCSAESRLADSLVQHLKEDFIGLVNVFLASDSNSVPTGSHWLANIVGGLHRSQLHVIICSRDSVYRPWINYEAGAAAVRDVPIVPLCHSGLLPAQLPVPLSESQGGLLTDALSLKGFYERIASMIGSSVPNVDFKAYAEVFSTLEQDLAAVTEKSNPAGSATNGAETEHLKDPHVLCVTSEQFRDLGYENQLEIVLAAFPKNIKHEFVLTSRRLKEVLLNEVVDIIHIAAYVCPRAGELYFSPVELPLGKNASSDPDTLTGDVLVALLQKARTRLVVLGASASLVLAAQLVTVTNVIAARDMVSAKAMASWVETFYEELTKGSLSAASETASQVSGAPMKLYAQQRQVPSMTIEISQPHSKDDRARA